jgi:hypothetical protein
MRGLRWGILGMLRQRREEFRNGGGGERGVDL